MDLLYGDSATRDHWCATDWRDLQNKTEDLASVKVKLLGQNKQEISLKKIFGGSQILTINATKFAGLDEGATPLGPYSATRGFTW